MKKLILTFIAFLSVLIIDFDKSFASITNVDETSDSLITQENINEKKDENEIKRQKTTEDLFGDEQTFPFVAGLGKNAAH
tara:strand:+ start:58 stop:297 length:240 start_codon:yes stop_codon:yes gene_type:complete